MHYVVLHSIRAICSAQLSQWSKHSSLALLHPTIWTFSNFTSPLTRASSPPIRMRGSFSCGTQHTAKQSSRRIANCRCGRQRLKLLWNLQRSCLLVPDRARKGFSTCWIFHFFFSLFLFFSPSWTRFNSFLFFFLKRNLFSLSFELEVWEIEKSVSRII